MLFSTNLRLWFQRLVEHIVKPILIRAKPCWGQRGARQFSFCIAVVEPMLPISIPNAPGAFVRPGSNSAAAASDPAMAAMFDWINMVQYGRRQQYRGNTGLDVVVRVFLNTNGEDELDRRQEYRRAARLFVNHAVRAALLRQTWHQC